MAKLCILCCFSYQPLINKEDGGDFEETWRKNPEILQEFCKVLKIEWNGLLNSLTNDWDQVSICRECLATLEEVVGMRRQMEETEVEVRRLQIELLEKMRKLRDFVNGWQIKLKILEGIVNGGDVGALESRRRRRRRGGEGEVMGLRRGIGEVVKEMNTFGGELKSKTGDLEVIRRRLLVQIEDSPQNEVTDGEAVEEDSSHFGGDEDQDDDPEENFKTEVDSDEDFDEENEIKHKTSTSTNKKPDPLKIIDTSSWSPFKLRIIRRLIKRNHNSLTSPPSTSESPPSPKTFYRCLSYNPTTNQLTCNSIPIIIQSTSLQCSLCPFTVKPTSNSNSEYFMDKSIIVHINGRHLDTYRCRTCLKSLLSPWRYLEHLKSHEGQWTCKICGKPCSTKDALQAHQWLHLNQEEREIALKSGQKNPRRNVLKDDTCHVCPDCGKTFKTAQYLRQHSEIHKSDREMTMCPLCGKRMLKHSYLVYHKNNCGSLNKVHCLVCNVSFKTKQFLNRHMNRVHSEEAKERRWNCQVCGKGFKAKGDLGVHLKIHGGEERWKCEKGCGKEFSVNRYWKRHERNCKGEVKQKNEKEKEKE